MIGIALHGKALSLGDLDMRMSRKSLKNAIDLALRRTDGRTFQSFFAGVMKAKHGSNFDATTTDYTQGDLKCDGLLADPMTVFACYGPVNAGHDQGEQTTQAAANKVTSDFDGALENWPEMTGWTFAHSFTETPAQFLKKIYELRDKHPHLRIEIYGRDRFIDDIGMLDDDVIEELVGDAALHEAVKNLLPQAVRDVVDTIMKHSAAGLIFNDPPKPVPGKKIEFNLPNGTRRQLLIEAYANSAHVENIITGDPDPTLQMRLAAVFKTRYEELDVQGIPPERIFDKLIDLGMTGEDFDPDRQAAALSVVAYLFQLCTIFREPPEEEAA